MGTLDYYNENALAFSDSTKDVEFTNLQDKFLQKVPEGGLILDLGCGSGRDSKYFLSKGYEVEAVDGSIELCKMASDYIGQPVKHLLFQDLDEVDKYDGVWACASLLHVKRAELLQVLGLIARALKSQGVFYCSFKYGDFEGERNGRYFTDMTEATFGELLKEIPELELEDQWITGDARPGRDDEKWLNAVVGKK